MTDIDRDYDAIPQSAYKQMAAFDQMPGEVRACVHEFGYTAVELLIRYGVKEPKAIRTILAEFLRGPRSPSNRTPLPNALMQIDRALLDAGCDISLKHFIRILHENHWTIVPRNPNRAMLDASMAAVANFDMKVTKERKHELRYNAAISAWILELETGLLRRA